MIITEYYLTRDDGVILDRTYSDTNHRIINVDTKEEYDDAVDPRELHRRYVESENVIVREEDESCYE